MAWKVVLGVIVLVALVVGWVLAVAGFIRQGEDASRIADLTRTNKQLLDGNKTLGDLVSGYESERSSFYRQFEDAVTGAKGSALDALKTVDRLFKLSEEIGN